MANCKHKFVYSRSNSYWSSNGRNSRVHYHTDYFFCEKCLEEKVIEKRHECTTSELWNLPDWTKTITTKIPDYLF